MYDSWLGLDEAWCGFGRVLVGPILLQALRERIIFQIFHSEKFDIDKIFK